MTKELLQEKLHKMQKDPSYRLFSIETESGLRSMPELKNLSVYLIITETEWFAKNGDQLMSSNQQSQNKVLFAETHDELFLPTADKTALYVSPAYPAMTSCTFSYFLFYGSTISAGIVSSKTSGRYYTIQLPLVENRCYCILDLLMTIVAQTFPDDVDNLRTFFNLRSKYNAGEEDIFEE